MISEIVEKLIIAKNNTNNRRQYWHNNTKKIIENALNKSVDELGIKKIGGSVLFSNDKRNLETVYLSLGIEHSGIIINQPDGSNEAVIKQNGHVGFSQGLNGKILVFYATPYFEKIGGVPDNKFIDEIDPVNVNEDWVLKHIEEFLNECLNFEDTGV